ncbi:MAG: endonuclease III domain-containing protein [Promethearchaeota archaeon]
MKKEKIKVLIFSGKISDVFVPLLNLFPQALRFLDPKIRRQIASSLNESVSIDPACTGEKKSEDMIPLVKSVGATTLASELDDDPFKTLIRTILSARVKDEQTIKVSEELFKRYDTPDKLSRAPEAEVKEILKPIGFYNTKARYIIDTAKTLVEEYGGEVPKDFKELTSLPGVGKKVASCVLVYAFNIPAIPVDTHVHRIVNRWGLVTTKNANETAKALESIFPESWWTVINDLLIRFGKVICLPIRPRCECCPLEEICPKLIKKKVKTRSKSTREKKKMK